MAATIQSTQDDFKANMHQLENKKRITEAAITQNTQHIDSYNEQLGRVTAILQQPHLPTTDKLLRRKTCNKL